MKLVTVHAAKTHLSKLIERACAGEDAVIARGRTPVVRLVPVKKAKPRRRFGAMRGRARTTKAFFVPLPPEELEGWDLSRRVLHDGSVNQTVKVLPSRS